MHMKHQSVLVELIKVLLLGSASVITCSNNRIDKLLYKSMANF